MIILNFDYIKLGRKWFDENDDFHIEVDNHFNLDIKGLKGALIKSKHEIMSIEEIKQSIGETVKPNNTIPNNKNRNRIIADKTVPTIEHRILYWNPTNNSFEIEYKNKRKVINTDYIMKSKEGTPYIVYKDKRILLYEGISSNIPQDIRNWLKMRGFVLTKNKIK